MRDDLFLGAIFKKKKKFLDCTLKIFLSEKILHRQKVVAQKVEELYYPIPLIKKPFCTVIF